MPRQVRIHYPGALYHVICRGNNREWIFENQAEKRKYLLLVEKYKKRYGFKLYSWVLMSNHTHMLIQVDLVSLSRIMQGIQQGYTQWYNRSHDRTGHVFEQRYKAVLCNKETYLLSLIRYIHQNPERAKMDGGIEYAWSSHRDYIKGNQTGITDIHFPLSLFSENLEKAIPIYRKFMDEEEQTIGRLSLEELDEGTKQVETMPLKRKQINKALPELIAMTATEYGIDPSELYGKSKTRHASSARKALILLCMEHTPITGREVAEELGLSETAITKMISRGLEDQRDRKERML